MSFCLLFLLHVLISLFACWKMCANNHVLIVSCSCKRILKSAFLSYETIKEEIAEHLTCFFPVVTNSFCIYCR